MAKAAFLLACAALWLVLAQAAAAEEVFDAIPTEQGVLLEVAELGHLTPKGLGEATKASLKSIKKNLAKPFKKGSKAGKKKKNKGNKKKNKGKKKTQCKANFYCPIAKAECCKGGTHCCPIGSSCVGRNKCAKGGMENALAIAKQKMEWEGRKTLEKEQERKDGTESALKRKRAKLERARRKKPLQQAAALKVLLKKQMQKFKLEKKKNRKLRALNLKAAEKVKNVTKALKTEAREAKAILGIKKPILKSKDPLAAISATLKASVAASMSPKGPGLPPTAEWCKCETKAAWGKKNWFKCDENAFIVGWKRGNSENLSSIDSFKCCKACRRRKIDPVTGEVKKPKNGTVLPPRKAIQAVDCEEIEWKSSFALQGNWGECPKGAFLRGLYKGKGDTTASIEKAFCCKFEGRIKGPIRSPFKTVKEIRRAQWRAKMLARKALETFSKVSSSSSSQYRSSSQYGERRASSSQYGSSSQHGERRAYPGGFPGSRPYGLSSQFGPNGPVPAANPYQARNPYARPNVNSNPPPYGAPPASPYQSQSPFPPRPSVYGGPVPSPYASPPAQSQRYGNPSPYAAPPAAPYASPPAAPYQAPAAPYQSQSPFAPRPNAYGNPSPYGGMRFAEQYPGSYAAPATPAAYPPPAAATGYQNRWGSAASASPYSAGAAARVAPVASPYSGGLSTYGSQLPVNGAAGIGGMNALASPRGPYGFNGGRPPAPFGASPFGASPFGASPFGPKPPKKRVQKCFVRKWGPQTAAIDDPPVGWAMVKQGRFISGFYHGLGGDRLKDITKVRSCDLYIKRAANSTSASSNSTSSKSTKSAKF